MPQTTSDDSANHGERVDPVRAVGTITDSELAFVESTAMNQPTSRVDDD